MIQAILLFVALFITAVTCSAQTAGNYSGSWELDTAASKLDERARIESMKMTVTQIEKDLTVSTETKRAGGPGGERPQGGPPAGGGMGRGMGGGFGGGDGKFTYSLDGKETTNTQTTAMGSVPLKLKAKVERDKLKLSVTRTVSSPMGEMTVTTKEEWSLSADGTVLTVKRDMETPRGTNSSTLVFKRP